jgi:2-isopropylmalate synthase
MIKDKSTYEIMTPNSIGLMWGNSQSGAGIVFGKHSGRNAFGLHLCKLGYNLDISKLNAIFARFKEVDKKKKGRLDDNNLESLVSKQAGYTNDLQIIGLQATTKLSSIPTATITMMGQDGIEWYKSATPTRPVDAVHKAINQIMGLWVILKTYSMNSAKDGIETRASIHLVT